MSISCTSEFRESFIVFTCLLGFIFLILKCSENGEYIQVLQYKNGEKYEPHFDYFSDEQNIAFGGHRIATVLMYLSNVKMGGETIFPDSEVTYNLIVYWVCLSPESPLH